MEAQTARETRWSLIFAAQATESVVFRQAWGTLCSIYRQPLYLYSRKRGHTHHDAEDLVQSFLASLYEHEALKNIARDKGLFRTFLLTCFRNFLANEHARASAQKRSCGSVLIPLRNAQPEEEITADPADPRTPEQFYDRQCALSLIERTFAMLQKEYTLIGKGDLFDSLKPHLLTNECELKLIADELGISEGNVRVTLHRLRKHFRVVLRELIDATVSSPQQADDELRSMIAALE